MGSAIANAGTIPEVPGTLKVPEAQVLSLEVQATGVQIYECKTSKDDSMRFEWVFKAPEAELFDSVGKRIGRHYAGPTWESNDGSKVVGEIRARDDRPDPTLSHGCCLARNQLREMAFLDIYRVSSVCKLPVVKRLREVVIKRWWE